MTPYTPGTPVTVSPCSMHADVPGRVLSRHIMREIRTDNHEAITEYWIRFEDGETCLHPHADVEMVIQAVERESEVCYA